MWSRKLSSATALFLVNRYAMLANRLVRLIDLVRWQSGYKSRADEVRSVRHDHLRRNNMLVADVSWPVSLEWYAPFISVDIVRCIVVWRLSEACTMIMHVAMASEFFTSTPKSPPAR